MYSSGFRYEQITVKGSPRAIVTDYGREDSTPSSTFVLWANVTFSRGTKSLREGALDSYDTLLIRTRYTDRVTRDCTVIYHDRAYRINSLNGDYKRNELQLTCTELV